MIAAAVEKRQDATRELGQTDVVVKDVGDFMPAHRAPSPASAAAPSPSSLPPEQKALRTTQTGSMGKACAPGSAPQRHCAAGGGASRVGLPRPAAAQSLLRQLSERHGARPGVDEMEHRRFGQRVVGVRCYGRAAT